MQVVAVEAFPSLLRRLAAERGLSVERLAHAAYDPNVEGTSPATLRKVLRNERTLNLPLAEALARVLDVPPETFVEYRLALARRMLDERAVGLEVATTNYDLLLEALPELPALPTPIEGDGAPLPPGELARRAGASPTTPSDRQQADSGRGKGRRRGAA